MEFKLLVDADVIDGLSHFSATRRNRFYSHFRDIQKFPANHSEFIEADDEGRMLDVGTFEDFVIRYWTDHADRCVKILQLAPND